MKNSVQASEAPPACALAGLDNNSTLAPLNAWLQVAIPIVGSAFKSICREYLWRLHGEGRLSFAVRTVSNWWGSHEEIDVMALGENGILVGECKWTTKPIGENILDDLARKAQPLIRQGQYSQVSHAPFARSGFTPALAARAEAESVLLATPQTLLAEVRSSQTGASRPASGAKY